MAQDALPLFAHLGVVAQQPHGHADQVVEIHALVGGKALLVALHDEGDAAFVVVLCHGQGLARVPALVLPGADGPLPLARGGQVGGAARAVLEDAAHIVRVENAERGLESAYVAVLAHHAHAQGVEGAHQHVLGLLADEPRRALAHFGGCLVGEGDGGNAPGRHARLDQPRNLVGDHPRLARARTGKHQAGALCVVDGLQLSQIESSGHGVEAGVRLVQKGGRINLRHKASATRSRCAGCGSGRVQAKR
ncbi:hypothetical protein SDC9_71899 [bioreactor metagenome]|uniref:Uncharacterized protein n=1 Tax=bioreactor metagenome TaxID=1076179 RepID=A0A644YA38_9ZZZZ